MMTNARLDTLLKDRASQLELCRSILDAADELGRDLTADQSATVEDTTKAIGELNPKIASGKHDLSVLAQARDLTAEVDGVVAYFFFATFPDDLTGSGGCHLNDKVFRDYLAPALKAVGREGVRIHDLRHFAGTQVARVGSLVETMSHLGHSTVSTSLRYQHMVSGRDAEIAEALSKLAQSPGDTAGHSAD